MDLAEKLWHLEEIKSIKARYCRYCDDKNWDGYFSLFAEDAVLDLRTGTSTDATSADDFSDAYQVGKANIIPWVTKSASQVARSVHHCHTPEIEFTSDTTANGIWALEDRLDFIESAPLRGIHAFGHYHETYGYIDGKWLITSCRLTRLRVDLLEK